MPMPITKIKRGKLGNIEVLRCPKCDHPLSLMYSHTGREFAGGALVSLTVACSRCCWSEFWGEYTDREVDCDRAAG